MGDTQGPARHNLIRDKMKKYSLKKLSPTVPTNYNFCGAETIIDYAYHTDNIEVSLEVLDHTAFPLNTSPHLPILYRIKYEKEVENIESMEIDPPIYIPDPSLPKKPIAPLILQHKKINIDHFDKELYKHKSTIYILTALPFIDDMNSCEKLSIIAHLL